MDKELLLSDLIHVANSKHDPDAVEQIVEKFKPIILKTAKRLNYDGADTDLVIHLIEQVYKLDTSKTDCKSEGELVNFICRIIKNRGVDLYRKKKILDIEIHTVSLYEIKEADLKKEEFKLVNECIALLNPKQKCIIVMRYFYGYSDVEIANHFKVSRQTICRTRKIALEIMRKELNGDKNGCTID